MRCELEPEQNPRFDGSYWFKVGFGLVIALFVVANVISYAVEASEFAAREIKFSHSGYSWGFPLKMYRNYMGYPRNDIGFDLMPTVINVVILGACAGICGVVFQAVNDRLRRG